jgi:predicted  nucleic acid-binding Zn-ribbon protein
MTKGADLYRLQCLDSDVDAKRRRLAEVEAMLGESETLQQARRARESAQALAQEWAQRQRNLELENQGILDEISHSEQRLYSGTIKNPKELADLQAKVGELRRRRLKLEDSLLEAMIEREETEAACTQAQEHLDDTEARWSAQQADLMTERITLQGELVKIEQARVNLLPSIEASDLATYEALRRRKGGLAVAHVRDGACSGCGVAISPSLEWQLRQGGSACCSNCERIIVRT